MTKKKWTLADMPNLDGKTAVVTGGNAGLGKKTCLELARRNANVVMACRELERGEKAADEIRAALPNAKIAVRQLNLARSDSIASFADQLLAESNRLDIVMNNAGIVNLETHTLTPEGQEMQMQVNHLGHFALIARLFPLIKASDRARIVVVNTMIYKNGRLDFDDFNWTKRPFNQNQCYLDSRLASMMFMVGLDRLFKSQGIAATAVAMHPGLVATPRQQKSGMGGPVTKFLAQPIERGCLVHLRASSDPDLKGGEYLEPRFGVRGTPMVKPLADIAIDGSTIDRLWALSETITNVKFDR